MTVDVERGLVFAPTGSPTSDFYGADRKGKNLYGNSLIALDASHGQAQVVPAARAPRHLGLGSAGGADADRGHRGTAGRIPAVAQITKMSTLFIFDRVDRRAAVRPRGTMPVPQSDVPGEATWPTQPFPVQPPPLSRTTFDPAKDFYTLTPEHAAYCRELWDTNRMYTKGMFTPPGLDGTMVMFPSTLGGGNWSGLSYDPARGAGVHEHHEPRPGRAHGTPHRPGRRAAATYRRTSPWGTAYGRFWNPQTKVPCSAPPFGELVAVDVNRGAIVLARAARRRSTI